MFCKKEYDCSLKFFDKNFIYKNVIISKNIVKYLKENNILYKKLSNKELNDLGIYSKYKWEHYIQFKNDPYTILLRRKITKYDKDELEWIKEKNFLMKLYEF